nr:P-loop NTPase fold protein [Methylorubrum extorquens]
MSPDEIWKNDLLDRRQDADLIQLFLLARLQERADSGRTASYVMNLDSSWGSGKTFFLERLQLQLESQKFISVYIDAWKDDHAEDPMIAFMAAIDGSLKKHLKLKGQIKKYWDVAKESGLKIAITGVSLAAKSAARRYLGDGLSQIQEIADGTVLENSVEAATDDEAKKKIEESVQKFIDVRAEAALKKFESTKSSLEVFRKNLGKFVSELEQQSDFKSPLFVLVDELDRCRPTYAIALLERVKHFFNVENVVFIVATDSEQLKHSIKAVYGQDFDSNKYLLRFFDRAYKFSEVSKSNFINYMFNARPISEEKIYCPFIDVRELFLKYAVAFSLSPRDIEQCYDHLRAVASTWRYVSPINVYQMILLIIAFQQGNNSVFHSASSLSITQELEQYFRSIGSLIQKDMMDSMGRARQNDIQMYDVMVVIYDFGQKSFRDVGRMEVNNYWKHELQGQFNIEYNLTSRNSQTADNILNKSFLVKYSQIVQTTGRFT